MPLRGSAKRVEQAGEEDLELRPQLVRQVGVGHVEPGGGDVVEGHGAAPVRVAERLEVALGGHRHPPAHLGSAISLISGGLGATTVIATADTPTTGQSASTRSVRCSTACTRNCTDFVPIPCRFAGCRRGALSLARVLALALVLIAPVAGDVTRDFDPGRPFEAGHHRGVDLAAAPGTPVRAACGGRVAFAGRIGTSGVVTVVCGPWRVTHMPLADVAVRAGTVSRGATIGTVAASSDHAGLHLGVRRDGTRFGYVDPLRLPRDPTRPVPLGRAPRGATNRSGRRAPARDSSRRDSSPRHASSGRRPRPRRRSRRGPRGPGWRSCSPAPAAGAASVCEPGRRSGGAVPWPHERARRRLRPRVLRRRPARAAVAARDPVDAAQRRAIGLAIGAGVAVIDTLYAAAGAAGAAGLLGSSRCGSRSG